jgi:hypothetical protein
VLSIVDDGAGVLPALARPEALETIAKSIGHSRKRQISTASCNAPALSMR